MPSQIQHYKFEQVARQALRAHGVDMRVLAKETDLSREGGRESNVRKLIDPGFP
jgi:hypothetical protein